MRGAVFAMGLLVFGGLLGACTSQEERAAEHRTAAEEYAEAEQWAEAKIEYLNLLRLAPDDAAAHYGMAEAVREIPLGRLGQPQDIANIVTFLASGKASYASGATIDVGGASFLH